MSHAHRPEELPDIDVRERGRGPDGAPTFSNRRLFLELVAFECEAAVPGVRDDLARTLADLRAPGVVYDDANHPRGLAVLSWSEDPGELVSRHRALAEAHPGLQVRPELTMLGRTYSTGFEQDLDRWLIQRPIETVLLESCPWAVWYPLRRAGAFSRLEPQEQGAILREHGTIGRAYAAKDLAHDVRLACHGLDPHDNEFVLGLVGPELYPLSHLVQTMRRTRQTSEFIQSMGPFFVGRVAHRSRG